MSSGADQDPGPLPDETDRALLEIDNRHVGKLLDAAPDAMVVVDGAGRIVLVNVSTERLFGYARHIATDSLQIVNASPLVEDLLRGECDQ